ncbi:unnamed protein product, partial [Bubo scandiacus]
MEEMKAWVGSCRKPGCASDHCSCCRASGKTVEHLQHNSLDVPLEAACIACEPNLSRQTRGQSWCNSFPITMVSIPCALAFVVISL